AVHVIVVVPAANTLADAGAQFDVTGGVPPVTIGAPYVTAAEVTVDAGVVSDTLDGQARLSVCTGAQSAVVQGCVGEPWWHAAAPTASTMKIDQRVMACVRALHDPIHRASPLARTCSRRTIGALPLDRGRAGSRRTG